MTEPVVAAAHRFRRALEAGGYASVGLQDFPLGACGDACRMLGQYLRDRGHGDWTYRTGRDTTGHTHAWLEQNGLLVDITSDQFPGLQPAVVVTTDPSWHDRFAPDAPARPADLNFDGPFAGQLRDDYNDAAALADSYP